MQTAPQLMYGLDDLPSWPRNLLYGFQWALIFLPTLTILSAICSEYLSLQGEEKFFFFQRTLIVTGAVVILQTLWGHRLPLLDGPSSALLLSFIVLAPEGLSAIQGGMIIGGSFLLILTAFRLTRYLENLFTDNVIGVILILIAITLLPYLGPMIIGARPGQPHGDPLVFEISVAVMVAIALFSHWLPGFPKTISLFLGVIFGTLLMWPLGKITVSGLQQASWFSLPQPFSPGLPRFSWPAAVSCLVAYIAVIVNAVGSMYSVGQVVGDSGMGGRVARGIGFTGLGGVAAGALGGIGTVSFGISPGVILVTRVGSRFAVTLCGILLFSLAFFQKFLALLSSIPAAVVGAAMITGLAAQTGAGISVFTRSGRILNGRDFLVVGVPILMGGIVSLLPDPFFQVFPPAIHALMKNGLVIGIILVLVLEHLLLRVSK